MTNKFGDFRAGRVGYGKSCEREFRREGSASNNSHTSYVLDRMRENVLPLSLKMSKPRTMEDSCHKSYLQSHLSLERKINSSLGRKKLHWKMKDIGLRETEDSVRQNKRQKMRIEDFECVKLLGRGKHGTVFLAVHKRTGFLGALKVFSKEDFSSQSVLERSNLQEMLVRELKLQSYVDHHHILKVYSIFSDRGCVYFFMELGTDGQLFDVFERGKTLREESVSFIMRGLLEAVAHLHEKSIIHRDIKPENVVLIHGYPKICDFGESSTCKKDIGELRDTLCGTPLYLSPEILMGQKYDEKIDIWALGAMAYELFTGKNPFDVKHKDELNKVITQQFQMVTGSIELRNFLTYALKKRPSERPSAVKLLRHPFIKKWGEIETAEELCR